VIIQDYGTDFDNAGWQHNMGTVALVGLLGARAWCQEKDPIGFSIAINHADWFVEHADRIRDFAVWRFGFPNAGFGVPAGWTSGYGNAYALALLGFVHRLTGDQKYIEVGRRGARGFTVSLADGGVRSLVPNGSGVFYEEVAHPSIKASYILNGHLLALQALDYYSDLTGDEVAAKAVREGTEGLRASLDAFDFGVGTLYDLQHRDPVTRTHYAMSRHVEGVLFAYLRTGIPIFLQYAFRWMAYLQPPYPGTLYATDQAAGAGAGDVDEAGTTGSLGEPLPATWPFSQEIPAPKPGASKALTLDLGRSLPVRSISQTFREDGFPTAYSILVAEKLGTWRSVAHEDGFGRAFAQYTFANDLVARYVRLVISKNSSPKAIYLSTFRVDSPKSWLAPMVIAANNGLVQANSYMLTDGDPATSLPLGLRSSVFVDMRAATTPTRFLFSGTGTGPAKITVAASNDLVTWTTVTDGEFTFPGPVPLPPNLSAWRYFRLHLNSDIDRELSSFEVAF
jgi:hypothetical protein